VSRRGQGRRARGRRGDQDAELENTAWLEELEKAAAEHDDEEEEWASTLRRRRSRSPEPPPPTAPDPPGSTWCRPIGGPPWGPPDPPGPWGSPDPSGSLELVKRVVGLPGERVRLVAGRLEVDGRAVAEPYLDATPGGGTRSTGARPSGDLDLRLGEDQYLLLGDHRAASTDGRDFGPVPAAALAGRVRFAYWPPRRLPDPARMPRSVQLRPTGGR
jgi:hypothetical protein